MIYRLYRSLTMIGAPLIVAYLNRRAAAGKEEAGRLGERMGRPNVARPPGKLVWVHAASVGEAQSVLPVIERIQRRPGWTALLTTGTVTSAQLMARRLPNRALHQYVPADRPAWVRAFLDHWRPDLALWCESEFWPNLVIEAARRMPMVLLQGRVSDRSFTRWRRQRRLIGQVLGGFALCLAQTQTDAERLSALGARRVGCLGNLKSAAEPLPVEAAALAEMERALGARPRWLAASTHPGEEVAVAHVHRRLAADFPGLLTVVVPRHAARGGEIAAELAAGGFAVARRSLHQPVTAETDILLADTMGEMGLFIRLAPIVFMGKSLLAKGGQNPLEPARLGASVMFGPHMENFAADAERLVAVGGGERIGDEEGLRRAVARRLADPELVRQSGSAGLRLVEGDAGVLTAVMAALEPWLAPPRERS